MGMGWVFLALLLGWLALTAANSWRVYAIERRWEQALLEASSWTAAED